VHFSQVLILKDMAWKLMAQHGAATSANRELEFLRRFTCLVVYQNIKEGQGKVVEVELSYVIHEWNV
jgi:hypothetical protein